MTLNQYLAKKLFSSRNGAIPPVAIQEKMESLKKQFPNLSWEEIEILANAPDAPAELTPDQKNLFNL